MENGGLRKFASPAARRFCAAKRLVHDAPNGPGAASALGAATEAAINLTRRAWRGSIAGQRPPHVMIREHVARTDDHPGNPARRWYQSQLLYLDAAQIDFNQNQVVLSYSNLLTWL